jgi:hypothetical protein
MTIRRAMRRHRPGFAADASGLSLIEFALAFPVLLTILLGTIELSYAMIVDRKVTTAAQALVDLVAQRETFNAGAANELRFASTLMLQPFDDDYTLSVVHIPFDDAGLPDMDLVAGWSEEINGGRAIPDAEAEAAATGLGTPGDAVVMVEFTYQYRPVLGELIMGPLTLTKTFFARPRNVDQIPHL